MDIVFEGYESISEYLNRGVVKFLCGLVVFNIS